jgi:hypothetical protein
MPTTIEAKTNSKIVEPTEVRNISDSGKLGAGQIGAFFTVVGRGTAEIQFVVGTSRSRVVLECSVVAETT